MWPARQGSLFSSAHVRPHMESCIQLWVPQCKKDMGRLKGIQMSSMKMVRGMEHHCYGEKLRQLGLFSLQKKRFWADLIVAFQYIKMAYKEDGERHVETGQGEMVLN